MSVLKWDETGKRLYETGVKKGVLYVQDESGAYSNGVAWNGLTAVTESPSGAEPTPLYADDIKYLNLMSVEEFGATIEAYTYPEEFEACNGYVEAAAGVYIGQQSRKAFGFSYVTTVGSDTKGAKHGYKIHIVYNALAKPSEKAYATVNDSPEAITFSWEVSTTPVNIDGYEPSASLTIDSTKCSPEKLKALEDKLYGTESEEATLPLPDEIFTLIGAAA